MEAEERMGRARGTGQAEAALQVLREKLDAMNRLKRLGQAEEEAERRRRAGVMANYYDEGEQPSVSRAQEQEATRSISCSDKSQLGCSAR